MDIDEIIEKFADIIVSVEGDYITKQAISNQIKKTLIPTVKKQIEELKAENNISNDLLKAFKKENAKQEKENTKLKERVKDALIYGYEIGVQQDQVINKGNVDKWEVMMLKD